MVCKKCGAVIGEEEQVCPNCGEPKEEGGFRQFISSHKIGLIIAAAAVLCVVLLVVFCNRAMISNFFRRTFSTPADYYHYVEHKTVEEFSADFGEFYSRGFLDGLKMQEKSGSSKMKLTLGEGGQELLKLAGLAGVDMSWFESVSLLAESSVKRDAVSMKIGAMLNEVDILTANVLYDIDDEIVYMQVPEINARYLGTTVPDNGQKDMEEVWELYGALERICPDQALMEQMLNRYLTTVVTCMDDVSKENEVLTAGDVSQKCTMLVVTVDGNTLQEMGETVLQKMREDEDIEKMIKAAAKEESFLEAFYLEDLSPQEAYDRFQAWIDSQLKDLAGNDQLHMEDGDSCQMKVYVDKKGKIVGRTLEIQDAAIHMLRPEKGKQYGYRLAYEDEGNDLSLIFDGGGQREGDLLEGGFILSYNDTSILRISVGDLDTKKAKKGMLNGRITCTLAPGAADLMGYAPGVSMLQEMKLTMDFQSAEDSGNSNMSLYVRNKNLFDIETSYQREDGYQGIEPGKDAVMIEDMEDLLTWGEDLDLGGLSDNLKKAHVPSMFTDSLDAFAGMDLESILWMMY